MKDAANIMGFFDGMQQVRFTERSADAYRAFVQKYTQLPQFFGFPARGYDPEDHVVDRTIHVDTGTEVKMYVDGDRWVGNCPHCNGGVAGSPQISIVICLDCGTEMTPKFPAPGLIAQAEVVLNKRPENVRAWDPWIESVEDLKAQNAVRGYPF